MYFASFATEDWGDFITRRTAQVAVLFWGLAAAALLIDRRVDARWLWTLGCLVYLLHVTAAFSYIHRWSHAAAFEHVDEVSGFGPGVFVSYGFSVLWIADACWWWADRPGYDSRPKWLDLGVHAFMAFVVFNGTVIYERGFIRWAGCAIFLGVALLLFCRLRRVPIQRFEAGP